MYLTQKRTERMVKKWDFTHYLRRQHTTIGTTYEWGIHNVAYFGSSIVGLEKYAQMAQSVNLGKTIFNDIHGGLIEHGMKISYIILNPIAAVHDLIINGGYR